MVSAKLLSPALASVKQLNVVSANRSTNKYELAQLECY